MEAVTSFISLLQKFLTFVGIATVIFGGVTAANGFQNDNSPDLQKGIRVAGGGAFIIVIGAVLVPLLNNVLTV